MGPQLLAIVVGLAVLGVVLLYLFFTHNTVICEPNEVVILSGRRRTAKDGTTTGYRVIRGGRGFRWPIVETVSRLSLTNIPVELGIGKALTAGIIPINIDARANVKVGTKPELLDRAIERFLGKKLEDIGRVAREAIEGDLRGVIATVTPEQANADRVALEKRVAERAREDLAELGLVLDYFKIKDLSDEQGYLESIGRRKNAEVRRDARIAEARAEAEARTVAAEQKRAARIAETEADKVIVEHENALAVHEATLEAESRRAKERASVAGDIARVVEERELEEHRAARNRQRSIADTIVPAEAEAKALEARARGDAATILENGRATAQAVRLMQEQWDEGKTKELFLLQMLPELLDKVTTVVKDNLRIDKITVVDSGESGGGLPSYVRALTGSAVGILEQMKTAAGVDVAALLKGKDTSGNGNGTLPRELG
jgi:flotillin